MKKKLLLISAKDHTESFMQAIFIWNIICKEFFFKTNVTLLKIHVNMRFFVNEEVLFQLVTTWMK